MTSIDLILNQETFGLVSKISLRYRNTFQSMLHERYVYFSCLLEETENNCENLVRHYLYDLDEKSQSIDNLESQIEKLEVR